MRNRNAVRRTVRAASALVIGAVVVAAWAVPALAAGAGDPPWWVGVTLGTTNNENGVQQIEYSPDGVTAPDEVGGQSCRKLVPNGGSRYMYLAVGDWYYPPGAGPGVTLVVEYYGANSVPFTVQYDAADGNAYKAATSRTTGSSGTWKKAVFWLPDPRFAGNQNGGADLRVATSNAADDFFIASVALARPVGPYVKGDQDADFSGETFGASQKVVATHYFYWYDIYSRAHFIDGDGTDALTEHPAMIPGIPGCEYIAGSGIEVPSDFSCLATADHRRELEDMAAAKVDIAMPVYWGGTDNMAFSVQGLHQLVAAMDQMVVEGHNPPKIAMFYDTSTLQCCDAVFNYRENKSNLTTEDGRNYFIKQVVDFFSMIPPRYWARIDGKPVVVTYVSGWTSGYNQQAFDELDARFAQVFGGLNAYVIRDVSWSGVTTESTIRFGAALNGPYIYGAAAVGPGYDDSAVQGRTPRIRPRNNGQTYIDDWSYVIANYSGNFVAAETWSEYHEGTDIANSREYGRQYINLTQEYASRFKGNWGGVDNAIVLDNTIPSTQYAGRMVTVTVTVKNTGSTTWSEAGGYRLGAVDDSDPFYSGTRVTLPAGTNVAPGQTYTFSFTMTAPAAGSYVTDWRMVHDGTGWFGETHRETVAVVNAAPVCRQETVSNALRNPEFDGTGGAKSANVTGSVPNDWRAFAVSPGTGEIEVQPLAANELYPGSPATHAVRWKIGVGPGGGPGGDSALDKWGSLAEPILPNHVYRLLVDVRDGGTYGGSPAFVAALQLFDGSQTYQRGQGYSMDPGAAFETTGITIGSASDSGYLGVRFDVGGDVNRSVFLDNARVHDVTEIDRMVNGGFENSATRLLNWRFFDTTAGNSASLSSEAHSGANAALLVRNTTDGDTGLDLDSAALHVAALGGESLNVACYAKKVSGDDSTRLGITVAYFDQSHVFLGTQTGKLTAPGSAYEQVYLSVTVPEAARYISVAFRVASSGGGPYVGSYLIDDVVVTRQAIPREGNILTDGDFEQVPADWGTEGSDLYDLLTIPAWRAFAVNGAYGFYYGRSEAASSGLVGMEIGRTATGAGGDAALDKDDPNVAESVPAAERIYRLLVDAKDGGLYGGTPAMNIGLFGGQPPWDRHQWVRVYSFDPGSEFETVGVLAKSTATGTQLGVRFDTAGADANRSVYVDNARVHDVTYGQNRVINPGFENSASRVLQWRFFAVAGATGSVSISSDAYSGSRAALLERTNSDGDLGLDLWGSGYGVPTLGGETITVSFAAKKVSGDASSRLGLQVATFDANGTFLGDAFGTRYEVGSGGYTVFTTRPLTLGSGVRYVSMGWRCHNDSGSAAPGAYLLDEASIVATEPAPPTPVNILTNGDFEADPDGTQVTGHDFVNTTTITGWRAFAVSGAAATMRVTSEAASHGAKGMMLARDPGYEAPGDRGFDNANEHFELKPGLFYHAEFWVKTGNTDGSNQTYRFNFPLFACQYLEADPGSTGNLTATATWQKVVAPVFRYPGATQAHIAWRAVEDGGEDAIIVAMPQVIGRPVAQDIDGDGDVDLSDFGIFQSCFNGPNRLWKAASDDWRCACLDAPSDQDVDLSDFGVFQSCFNGPNRPPKCGG